MKRIALMVAILTVCHIAKGGESSAWIERLVFWAAPEIDEINSRLENVEDEISALPAVARVNSSNRTGFQTGGKSDRQNLWVELEFPEPTELDTVVLVPLLTKGSGGEVPGFGFPKRFILEAFTSTGASLTLINESRRDFPPPGLYPVTAPCPAGTAIQRIRLTATLPWRIGGPSVLALSEIMTLHGNRNLAGKAKVRSSSSREILPSWSRNNLIDMVTPLGLPISPGGETMMGWQGPSATRLDDSQSITVDLGQIQPLDEIRLLPAWHSSMTWDSYYGFPPRFKVETSITGDFTDAAMIHDRTDISLLSPGQNIQCFPAGGKSARFIRVTATRLRERMGEYVFALGELQAYSGNNNVALHSTVIGQQLEDQKEWSREGLTDGLARGGRVLELPEWLRQLEQRRILEQQRKFLTMRRSEVFTSAEHALVGASVCGAGGIALMAGLFSWKGHRNRVLDRERHRERLARDLHDELGSNLGSIALISSFASQEDADQMRLDLAEIERVARESADSMRDMVSLLGGRRGGSAADWLNVLNSLAQRLIRGVDLECGLPTAPLIWEPNLETRREIYLFCKEVLHNAIRHGKPSQLKFLLSPTPHGIRVEIRDNGCGFKPSTVHQGHGLGNLRERAAMMKGRLLIQSEPGSGTSVILEIPRGRRWKNVRKNPLP